MKRGVLNAMRVMQVGDVGWVWPHCRTNREETEKTRGRLDCWRVP